MSAFSTITAGLSPVPFAVQSLDHTSNQEIIQSIQATYQEGRTLYGADMRASKTCLLRALFLQMTQFQFTQSSANTESLTENYGLFEEELTQLSVTSFIEKVQSCKLDNAQLLFLAQNLRWLGHTYQNISEYKTLAKANHARFLFIYGAAEELLKLNDSSEIEVKKEFAELYYNTGFFMHLRQYPGDYLGACETYAKALEWDSSDQMKARVSNMRSLLQAQAKIKMSAQEYKEKVLDRYLGLPADQQDKHLVAMYHYNYAQYLLAEEELKMDLIEEALKPMQDYMKKVKAGEAEPHSYFPMYCDTIAQVYRLKGDEESAIKASTMAAEYRATAA